MIGSSCFSMVIKIYHSLCILSILLSLIEYSVKSYLQEVCILILIELGYTGTLSNKRLQILYPSVCRLNPVSELRDIVSSNLVVLSSLMLVVLVVSSQNIGRP